MLNNPITAYNKNKKRILLTYLITQVDNRYVLLSINVGLLLLRLPLFNIEKSIRKCNFNHIPQ